MQYPRYSYLYAALVTVLILVASVPAFAGTTYYVTTTGDDGDNGTSWATALLTISNGVAKADDGDTVLISNGTYQISAQISVTTGTTVRSVNGYQVTTVDGNNACRCFYLSHADAVVDGFTITRGTTTGAGVKLAGAGVVQNCNIVSNNCGYNYAGGIHCDYGGTVRDCLVIDNISTYCGGVYCDHGGVVENCTIVGNSVGDGEYPGGILLRNGGTMKNTLVYDNLGYTYPNWRVITAPGPVVSNSCTTPALTGYGDGNITNNPIFINADAGDYRIAPGSPCIDQGTNLGWMATATDIAGSARITNGITDMGAYEYQRGALDCHMTATPREGIPSLEVVFTGYAAGTNTSGLVYKWDLDTNGVADETGVTITNNYNEPGTYSVALTVTNAIGESITITNLAFITVGHSNICVATSGSDTYPYTNWTMAASNIQDAVDAAVDGSTILVTNGTYLLSEQIMIAKDITVRSINGYKWTTVDGNDSYRCFYINRVQATIKGLTVTGGKCQNGGGIYLNQCGLAQYCNIVSNDADNGYSGGIHCFYGGTLRNCLITDNTSRYTGGGVLWRGGSLENCTIANNSASDGSFPGGIYFRYGGTATNTIIYDNQSASFPNWRVQAGPPTIHHSCTIPSVGGYGSGNMTNEPMFVDGDAGDYRLQSGTPCFNTGTNLPWMVGVLDFAGNPRINTVTNDIGAYEYQWGLLNCSFVGVPTEGVPPLDVVFTASVDGTNVADLYYIWDFNTNGVPDQEGSTKQVVTNTYASPGTYSICLTVTNSGDETALSTNVNYVSVSYPFIYVSTNGSDTSPYTNWSMAASNIQDAVDVGGLGSEVLVSNGTYVLSQQIELNKGLTVRSVNGYRDTTIDGNNVCRCFYLSHAAAIVDGFTLTRGTTQGAGAYMNNGGMVRNSCIVSNNAGYNYAGGVWCYYGGILRNCMVRDNTATYCGGVYLDNGGVIENCTIVGNRVADGSYPGGVLFRSGGGMTNSIVYNNIGYDVPNWNATYSPNPKVSFSCTTPSISAYGAGNTTSEPGFSDAVANDYTLLPNSPCRDTGTNIAWMASTNDLDGNPRISNSTNDMGAYEYPLGALACQIAGTPRNGLPTFQVVFTGSAAGTNTTGLVYKWDFDTNGVPDGQGITITNTYTTHGTYSVALTVTNAIGENATTTNFNYISAGYSNIYVATTGSDTYPYTNWAMAASNIQDAIDAGIAGTLVSVGDGRYVLSAQLTIEDGITVRSVNGYESTTIDGDSSYRCLYVAHDDAIVDGFTLTKGNSDAGGAAYLDGGGTIQKCNIVSNNSSSYAGGVECYYGGLVRNCLIITNNSRYAGAVYVNHIGVMENCTMWANRASDNGFPGGVYLRTGGSVTNCIIYGNHNAIKPNWLVNGGAPTFFHTCTYPSVDAYGSGNITNDPQFIDTTTGNFQLMSASPCRDTGTNIAWMVGEREIGGYARILDGTADMGAHEFMRTMNGTIFMIR